MTLGRLLIAWLFVALWFAVVAWLVRRRAESLAWATGEALVLTLLASLWFDSLGHGGWWLVFFLVGILVAYSELRRAIREGVPARRAMLLGLLDTARYVLAGGILAWRLA